MTYLMPNVPTCFDGWPNKAQIIKQLEDNLKLLPESMRDVMFNYIVYGLAPGHFLTAVLSNNLNQAVQRGDQYNVEHLHDYVKFLYWSVPMECWGSDESVTRWLKHGAEVRQKESQHA